MPQVTRDKELSRKTPYSYANNFETTCLAYETSKAQLDDIDKTGGLIEFNLSGQRIALADMIGSGRGVGSGGIGEGTGQGLGGEGSVISCEYYGLNEAGKPVYRCGAAADVPNPPPEPPPTPDHTVTLREQPAHTGGWMTVSTGLKIGQIISLPSNAKTISHFFASIGVLINRPNPEGDIYYSVYLLNSMSPNDTKKAVISLQKMNRGPNGTDGSIYLDKVDVTGYTYVFVELTYKKARNESTWDIAFDHSTDGIAFGSLWRYDLLSGTQWVDYSIALTYVLEGTVA
jgi:hypothetical protein